MTGTREKIKSLFGRHKDDETESPPSSPKSPTTGSVRSSKYEGTAQGQSPLKGQRPISGAEQPSQQPKRSRSLRRSFDRKSIPAAGDSTRRSVDGKRKSLDTQYVVNPANGSAPQVPRVPSSFRESGTVPTGTSATQGDPSTEAAKVAVRRSSNARASQPLSPQRSDVYSEDVADWNVIKSQRPADSSHVPTPLNVSKTAGNGLNRSSNLSSPTSDGQEAALARKPVGSEVIDNSKELGARRTSVSSTKQKQRTSMDKPLPNLPSATTFAEDPALSQYLREPEDPSLSKYLPKDHEYLEKNARGPISLEGVVDLRNTEDTNVIEQWAPAVTHETVNKNVHHIQEEVITREIHNHDWYHRILPIKEIEVLPARHFVPAGDGNLIEISADEIPGSSRYKQEWFVGEMLSKLPKSTVPTYEPRRFTAREFPGTEGDYKEYISDKGVPTTETTWVHPPVLAQYAYQAGLTQPFYFGTEQDGLRTSTVKSRIIGSSQRHAEQQKKVAAALAEAPTESMRDLSVGDYLKAVPSAEPSGNEPLTPAFV